MIYRFGSCELDMSTIELRVDGVPRNLEPQVFSLLALLIENRERLVSKDEIIEKVWDGRIVSDAALASRVKSARQAIGDDGKSQRFVRTVHTKGLRFVAPVRVERGFATGAAPADDAPEASARPVDRIVRPSLAVLPFRMLGANERFAALASALPDELITELSRLHWLFVTARGSSFRLHADDAEYNEIGRLLRVRYCLSGTIDLAGRDITITVELVDTEDGGVVWADRLSGRVDDVHALREDIRLRVLAALEIQIPAHEAALARGKPSEDLDAWSAFHLGLQYMYRFNRADNAVAAGYFQRALALDPRFARAHAGASFLHFQTAFLHHSHDVAGEIARARRCAERAAELDPLDPFVNFAMGRTFWLEGDLESSLAWLERSTRLSPNYAQGIYARAWTESLSERAIAGRDHVDLALRLSPLDPLHYAMLATRAFTHWACAEYADAALWAERGARSPGAHVLIAMIAAAAHALNGDDARAAGWAANVRERNAALSSEDFFRAFPMQSQAMRESVQQALTRLHF
jgi:TolB-like protein